MRLLLVRHAESIANSDGILQGHADVGLSDKGRRQAAQLRNVLSGIQIDAAISSDLRRAVETADLLGFAGSEQTSQLREIHVGAWQGCRVANIKAEDSAAYAKWRAGTYTPPGGEDWSEFQSRVMGFVGELSRRGAQQVLLVVHSGVVRGLLSGFLGFGPDRMIPVTPASLTVVRIAAVDRAEGNRLEVYNCSPHVRP